MTPFRWSDEHLAAIGRGPARSTPPIAPGDLRRVRPGHDIWDHWPALREDGGLAVIDGGLLVVALTAPHHADPQLRHATARLRLFHRTAAGWRDLGDAMPDGFSPGSREWAGSAVLEPGARSLSLFFTAAGSRGEPRLSFAQRLFACRTTLDRRLRPGGWTDPVELVRPDGRLYQAELEGGGAVGTIKAFRDPYAFREPGGSDDWLVFAGSRADSGSGWNGLIGAARRDGSVWTLGQPWVDATGVNNELERPHVVARDGRLYLFWSTQASVFATGSPPAPTGLYGVVADRLGAPWRPLNGDTLVLANPAEAPMQAYSWQVLPDLSVWSFADVVGDAAPQAQGPGAGLRFAGCPAPPLRLSLNNDAAVLVA